MAIEVKKIVDGDLELLPDIIDTPLWMMLDPDYSYCTSKSNRQLARLYKAICERENYFQLNSPTAFGNPDYSLLCGVVLGVLQTIEAEESIENGRIVIRACRDNRIILAVDGLQKPTSYYAALKEVREARAAIGI